MEESKQKKPASPAGGEESCPLCKVSEDTLEKLENNRPKNKKIKKPFWKLW